MAESARTLGDLVDDLQRPDDAPAAPRPPHSNRRRWYQAAVSSAAVSLAASASALTSGVSDTEPAPRAAAPAG
ncbi:hypothetical protein [Nocardia sp. NPDC005998]|uniref:hypothetical protein n=1 Tax=Nocardia sp. NPDC005998 TaxID=3156894 RepID=UPI0033A5DEDC